MSRRRSEKTARRAGMTLIELMVAATVMSLVAVVLGGLANAVQTTREHVEGVHEAAAQGRFVVDRVRSAVRRSGFYRLGGGATVAGVAVVWNADRPETLVVWTGGREASLAAQSPLDRRPRANELVIFTPDPAAPEQLVEIVVPAATDVVDFEDKTALDSRIRQLVTSPNAEKVVLCDRTRVALSNGTPAATVRFESEATPDKGSLASTSPDTAAWRDLDWFKGVSSRSAGLRQIRIRIELQVVTLQRPNGTSPSLPVFGAAERYYVFRKG